MKRNHICSVALAAAMLLTLASCTSTTEPQETLTPPPVVSPTERVEPSVENLPEEAPIWGEQTFSKDFYAGDGTLVQQVSYTLPKIENPERCPAGAEMNAWYQAEGEERLAQAEEQYELQVADYDVSSELGFAFHPMVEEMTSEIVCNTEVISVRRELSVNFGGAYPLVYCFSEQFDAATGKRLTFADFFTDTETVMNRVTDAFLEQTDLGDGTLSREEVSVVCHPENFYYTEDGYVFWIQADSLTAVHSPITVTIPTEQLSDVSHDG